MNYFKRKFGNNFERPYGWAWLLKLQAELDKNAQVNTEHASFVVPQCNFKTFENMSYAGEFDNGDLDLDVDLMLTGNWKQLGGHTSTSLLTCCFPA